MSSRVTVNGRSYHRDPGAAIRPIHRPVIEADPAEAEWGTMTRCRECQCWCYAVRAPWKGADAFYWRHQPDTFWTSR